MSNLQSLEHYRRQREWMSRMGAVERALGADNVIEIAQEVRDRAETVEADLDPGRLIWMTLDVAEEVVEGSDDGVSDLVAQRVAVAVFMDALRNQSDTHQQEELLALIQADPERAKAVLQQAVDEATARQS